MFKIIRGFTTLCLFIILISCVSVSRPSSATQTDPRTIILDNETISEEDVGGFTSWYCLDYVYEEKGILLEFGYFNDSIYAGMGFILYDGGYTGEFTYYQRNGVEHRWDWGPDSIYSFIIKPDGTGLYYDFTYAKNGESIKARDVYKCYKR
jgi:hypothetical protein